MTSLAGVPFANFAGGIQLVDQGAALDSSMAIDLGNVRMGSSGEVKTRPGMTALVTGGAAAERIVFWDRSAVDAILVQNGAVLTLRDMANALIASVTMAGSGKVSTAKFAAPGVESLYVANGSGLYKAEGSTLAVLGATATVDGVALSAYPKPVALGVTGWDNRLVAAGFNGANDGPGAGGSSGSTVFFSELGDPATWKNTYRNHLTPGDGEVITAVCSWRDRLFVFKQTKFFVFYGTSSDGAGNPIFDYFMVDQGIGAAGQGCVAAGRDGVYMVSRDGIFVTDGEGVSPISSGLDPLFGRGSAPFFSGELMDVSAVARADAAVSGSELCVVLPTSDGKGRLWTFDVDEGWWAYDTPAVTAVGRVVIGGRSVVMVNESTAAGVQWLQEGAVVDVAGEIESWWRSSWQTFGSVGEKRLRQSQVWGFGDVALSYSVDFGGLVVGGHAALGGDSDVWGDGLDPVEEWAEFPALDDVWSGGSSFKDDWIRYGIWGEFHSFELRGVAGSVFSVQRVEHDVLMPRPVGIDSKGSS